MADNLMRRCAGAHLTSLVMAALLVTTPVAAKNAVPASADPELEKKTLAIAAELRCLVCQNQTIADSDAGLAVDLRNQVREMVRSGKSQQEITAYMTERYGDFVLYRPPVNSHTALLWFGPPVLLLAAAAGLFAILRRRNRLAPDQFEPDEEDGQPLPPPYPASHNPQQRPLP